MNLTIGDKHTSQRIFTQADFDRFALLSGDDNPIHVDPEFAARTRFGRTVAHGMLLYSTLCGVMGTHYPGPGTVQLEGEMMFSSPTFVGELVTIQLEVTRIDNEAGWVEMNTSLTRPRGESGLEGRSMMRTSPPGRGPVSKTPTVPTPEGLHQEPFKGLQIGQTAAMQRTFTRDDLTDFAQVSRDENPLHIDPDYASRAGFQDTPIPGGLLAGMFSCLLGTELPGRGTNWLRQKLTFLEPAHPSQRITACVEIVRLRPAKDLVNLRTDCVNPEGELVCTGEALVLVKDLEFSH